MSTPSVGPYYVILGEAGGVRAERPAMLAMGAYSGLLPIVVACARREHADAVYALNAELMRYSSRDAHALAFSVQQSGLRIPNSDGCKIYVIRKTLEAKATGVWIGFKWSTIKRNIGHPPTSEDFTGKLPNVKEAIIYMLDKDGYNFPDRANLDTPIAQPRRFLPRSTHAPRALAPQVTTSVPNMPTSPKGRGTDLPPSLASNGLSPSKPRGRASAASTSSDDSFASAQGDETGTESAIASMAVSEVGREREDALTIQVLAQFIAPPATMSGVGENIFRFPISFGKRADEYLMMRAPTEGELWSLLRVRIHAENMDQFVHHFSYVLGHKFNVVDARTLWSLIQFPCV